jgi:hypothetical protein
MSAAEAIRAARTAGVQLAADGGDLVLKAASPPSASVIDNLERHKADVLKLLRPTGNAWSNADWHVFFENVLALPSSTAACRVQKPACAGDGFAAYQSGARFLSGRSHRG